METLSSVLGMAQYKPTDRSVNQFFALGQKEPMSEAEIGASFLSFSGSTGGYRGFSASLASVVFVRTMEGPGPGSGAQWALCLLTPSLAPG
ncbi:hypothetical protein [Paraburkholderia oxyphila]|uniref:hypothetical protein n=1 Tax=Paraburkholderia oxyphila TaxID=614212 RepID=UPI0012EE5832|nr:hypothetical protein [Paraburkholderia oxyphila]